MPPCCGTDAEPLSFRVPASYHEYLPDPSSQTKLIVSFCPRCLALEWPAEDAPADEPNFSRVSESFPTGEAGIPFALALGLCSSLATNREAIADLLEEVERAGTDPLLAMDRLLDNPEIEPAIDLARRRHQVEQLLY